ncbi:uncharacterized protein LOC134831825 [Culicoides brevitarsis]|uniref:uncharacterized protein LOC134831825 n=1 Tax=Culicoides brevitarsis TaxID=469753 RepID=UPI00307B7829
MSTTNDETGEIENSVHLTLNDFDLETGESINPCVAGPNMNIFRFGRKSTTFQVPKSCLEETKKHGRKSSISNKRTYSVANKKDIINLKEAIILGYNKTSHRMFFIPSLFMFPQLSAAILIVTEILLHIWAHRRNSKNTNDCIYYRSPLHALTSQFCGRCRQTMIQETVSELHDKRLRKYKSLWRYVSRSIG